MKNFKINFDSTTVGNNIIITAFLFYRLRIRFNLPPKFHQPVHLFNTLAAVKGIWLVDALLILLLIYFLLLIFNFSSLFLFNFSL